MTRAASFVCALALAATVLSAQQAFVNPATFNKPPVDSWPTYNGDYSGRRFSPLTKITASNVHSLSLGWTFRVASGLGGGVPIKGTPLMIDGVTSVTVPDHVWDVDARNGRGLWY